MNTEKFFEGPGNSDMLTYVWELAFILCIAFILGYLLRLVLNEGVKKRILTLESENARLYTEAKQYETARSEIEKNEIQLGAQKREIDKLNTQLSECFASRVKAENALSLAQSKDEKPTSSNEIKPEQPTDHAEGGVMPLTSDSANKIADDLKKIEGIGPKIEQLLNNDGLINFRDITEASVQRIKGILIAAGPNYAVHDPSTWAEQAQLAHQGKWDELALLQEDLKGGKRK